MAANAQVYVITPSIRRLIEAIVLAIVTAVLPAAAASASPLHSKADPELSRQMASAGSVEFLVVMADHADDVAAGGARAAPDSGSAHLVARLQRNAARAQRSTLEWLAANAIRHQPFWVANVILVHGDSSVAASLAARSDVSRLEPNTQQRLDRPESLPIANRMVTLKATNAPEPGVQKVRAPEVWASGFTGQGIVVGIADTGADWDHPALKSTYRGWNGSTANHNYSWHDAIHSNGGTCGANSPVPCDDGNHGTAVLGAIVGDSGGVNQIGVAPGARWIACRNMDQGVGTPARHLECLQWFMAPTNLAGQNPDASKAPHVVSLPWTCSAAACTDVNVLRTAIGNLNAAGIVVVSGAGNAGSSCATVSAPPPIHASVIAVGATDINDAIAAFSSRGPVTSDGSGRRKPDVTAPGVNIRTSVPGIGYASFSGTSFSSAYVAGAAALLLSARPALVGQPTRVQQALQGAAVPLTSAQTCGGIAGASVPNNTFGHGRIDVKAALDTVPLTTLDLDASITATRYDALTDGVLALRYLFGLTGPALTAGALGTTASRTNADNLKLYLDSIRGALDVDGNQEADALTDGLLTLRYLFGIRGAQLTQGAIGPGATRTSVAQIEAFLQSLTP